MDFCITGLPRSRTAWFAAYFRACGYKCAHEGMRDCESIASYIEKMEYYDGNSDSGCVFYPLADKVVIIERDKDDVKSSLKRYFDDVSMVDIISEKMDSLDGLRVKYEDINERLQEIHEYCVDDKYDPEIGNMFKELKITTTVLTTSEHSIKLLGELLCLGR